MKREVRLATRGSALALWQANWVAEKLTAAGVAVEIVVVKTTGDARQDIPLQAMAGRGVFVKEIENALLIGEADVAVHSAKDLPSRGDGGIDAGGVWGAGGRAGRSCFAARGVGVFAGKGVGRHVRAPSYRAIEARPT